MHGPTCIFWANLTPFSRGAGPADHISEEAFVDMCFHNTVGIGKAHPGRHVQR